MNQNHVDVPRCVSVHGHFYQPPRENPYTHEMPREVDAGDYHDWNERILVECYRPNAQLGNFERMSFDIGPTLADWMRRMHPDVLRRSPRVIARQFSSTGYGAAIAQSYHHTIRRWLTHVIDDGNSLGCALVRIALRTKPVGIWLPETAIDLATLEACAAAGLRYTIVAPQQVSGVREARRRLSSRSAQRRRSLWSSTMRG